MDPKGHALIRMEFEHTKIWPDQQLTLDGMLDLEADYKEALAGKLCPVMDIGVDGSYLVFGEGKRSGGFIWMIEKEDVRSFIPVIKKNGMLIPGGMSPMEEFEYMLKLNLKKHA